MDADEIEAAYEEFVSLLRSGDFAVPVDGWTAEMIGAHVALNNDEIAAVAEAVTRGESVAYDNAAGVDDATLREFAERAGGREGVADEIDRTARRLAQAQRALGAATRLVEIPVVIHDQGQLVVDRPLAIGDFVVGNATYHLELHLEQLKTLGT